ncbi:MAG: hypothetical protein R3C44_20385 [Chloroflexota bacterium]
MAHRKPRLKRYKAIWRRGSGVVAYYNPVNPAEAALNLRPPVYLPLFVGFYWIILLVFLIPALRSWWASRRTPEP